MKYFGLLAVFLCLFGHVLGQSDAGMYFEGSGGDTPNAATGLPFDDEDTTESSGEGVVEVPESEDTDIEEIDIDGEPEVSNTGRGGKTKHIIIEDKHDDKEIDVDENKPVDKDINHEELEDEEVNVGSVASGTTSSFLAAMIVGGCIGLLFAICVIMLLVYRMRKKDEGSYALEFGLDKKPQGNYEYTKGVDSKEYFA